MNKVAIFMLGKKYMVFPDEVANLAASHGAEPYDHKKHDQVKEPDKEIAVKKVDTAPKNKAVKSPKNK